MTLPKITQMVNQAKIYNVIFKQVAFLFEISEGKHPF
jgi:hypothetical protein